MVEASNEHFLRNQSSFFDDSYKNGDHFETSSWNSARRYEVKSIMNQIQPRSVLNLGCGVGFHDLEFAMHEDVVKVVGVDYSPNSIKVANSNYPHEKVSRFATDFMDLEESIKYDLVTSFQVIEHLDFAQSFIAKCANLVTEKGYVAIFTPNRLTIINRLRKLARRQMQVIDPMHFKEFTAIELESLAKSVNLHKIGTFSHSLSFRMPYSTLNLIPRGLEQISRGRFVSFTNVIGLLFQKN
jgi:cyclopropane fatty-acyl-phospholipid synthase-like methyltransferase